MTVRIWVVLCLFYGIPCSETTAVCNAKDKVPSGTALVEAVSVLPPGGMGVLEVVHSWNTRTTSLKILYHIGDNESSIETQFGDSNVTARYVPQRVKGSLVEVAGVFTPVRYSDVCTQRETAASIPNSVEVCATELAGIYLVSAVFLNLPSGVSVWCQENLITDTATPKANQLLTETWRAFYFLEGPTTVAITSSHALLDPLQGQFAQYMVTSYTYKEQSFSWVGSTPTRGRYFLTPTDCTVEEGTIPLASATYVVQGNQTIYNGVISPPLSNPSAPARYSLCWVDGSPNFPEVEPQDRVVSWWPEFSVEFLPTQTMELLASMETLVLTPLESVWVTVVDIRVAQLALKKISVKDQVVWFRSARDWEPVSEVSAELFELDNATVVVAREIGDVSVVEQVLGWDDVGRSVPEASMSLGAGEMSVANGAVLAAELSVSGTLRVLPNQTVLFHVTLGNAFARYNASLQNYLAASHSFPKKVGDSYARVLVNESVSAHFACRNEATLSCRDALIYEGVTLAPLFSTRSAVLGPAVSRHRVLYAGSAKLSEGTSTPYIRSYGSLTFARDASRRVRGAWLGSGGRRVGADVSGLLGEVRVPAGAGQYLDRTVVGRLCGEARRQYEESFFRFYEPFVSVGVGVGEKGGVEADASLVVDTAFTWAGGVGSVSSVGSGQVDVSGTVAVLGDGKVTVEAEVAVSLGHVNTSSDPTAKMTLNLQSGNGTRQGGRLTVYGGRLADVTVVVGERLFGAPSGTGLVLGGGRFTLSGEVVVDVEDFALCQVATVLPVSASAALKVSAQGTSFNGTVLVDGVLGLGLGHTSPRALLLLRGSLAGHQAEALLDVSDDLDTRVLWDTSQFAILAHEGSDSSVVVSAPEGGDSVVVLCGEVAVAGDVAVTLSAKTAGLRAPAVHVEGADVVLLGGARGVDGCVSVLVLEHVFRLQSTGLAGNVLHVEGCVWFAAATQWEVGAPASTPTPASQDTAEVWFGGGVEHVVSCRGGCRMLAVAVVAVHTEARLLVLAGTELGAGVVEVAVAGLGELSLFEGARVGGDVKVALHGVLRASHADVSGRLALDGELSGPLHQCGGGLVSVGGDLVVGEQASLACDTAVVGEGGGRVDGWAGEVGVSVEVVTWGGALVGEGRLVPRDASCVAPKDFGEMRNTVSGRTLRLSVETATPASPHVYTVAAALLAGVVGVYVVLLPLFLQHGVFGLWAAVVERPPFPLEMETIGMYTWGNALACAHMVYEAVLFASVGFHTGVLWPSGVVGTQHFLTDVLLMQGVGATTGMVLMLAVICLSLGWGVAWLWMVKGLDASERAGDSVRASVMYTAPLQTGGHMFVGVVCAVFLLPLLLLILQPFRCVYDPLMGKPSHNGMFCWDGDLVAAHAGSVLASVCGSVLLVFMTFHVGNNLSMPLGHPPFRQGLDVRHKRVFEAVRVGVIQVQAILLSVLGTAENAGALVWGSFVLQGAYLAFALVSHPCVFKGVNRVRWLLQYSGVAVVGVAAVSTAVHGARTSAQCGAHGGVWMLVVLGVLLAAGVGAFVCTLTPWFQARVAREREAHPRYELYKWGQAKAEKLKKLQAEVSLNTRWRVPLTVFSSLGSRVQSGKAFLAQLQARVDTESSKYRQWQDVFAVPYYLSVPSYASVDSTSKDDDEVTDFFDETCQGWVKGSMLGSGSFGAVYLAVLPGGQMLAVKVIELDDPALDTSPSDPMIHNEHLLLKSPAVKKIKKEVDFIRNLKHPNVIEYKACLLDREANTINIFMEYAVGGSLASLVKKCTRRLPEDTVRLYVVQILQGLSFLHAKGIIHRDIKGDNVLLDASGNAKLADFGCAKEMASATRLCGTYAGTPYWMAPEVIRNKGYDAKADIWSVGCTTIEALNRGQLPWKEKDSVFAAMYHISKSTGCPDNIPEGLTDLCLDFLGCCFVRDWQTRPGAEDCANHPWLTGPCAGDFLQPSAPPAVLAAAVPEEGVPASAVRNPTASSQSRDNSKMDTRMDIVAMAALKPSHTTATSTVEQTLGHVVHATYSLPSEAVGGTDAAALGMGTVGKVDVDVDAEGDGMAAFRAELHEAGQDSWMEMQAMGTAGDATVDHAVHTAFSLPTMDTCPGTEGGEVDEDGDGDGDGDGEGDTPHTDDTPVIE